MTTTESMTSRLPAATRMGRVHLRVRDLDATSAFYQRALGLRVLARDADAHELGSDEALVRLEHAPDAPRRPANAPGLYHTAFLLPARADLARLLDHYAQTRQPLQGAADHLVSEAVYLADPEGNGIEVYADRPRDAWTWNDGRLEMATAVLDIEGLLAEKGDARWTGAPDGTRVGHVHLKVADALRAEVFYRDVVGFDVTTRYGADATFLSAGGYHHHLAANAWESRGAPPAPEGALGLAAYEIVLPTREALAEAVARVGGDTLTDPSGNRVFLRG